jgi:DinB family protein
MSMDETWRTSVWQQFGAAIDMLENCIEACPDSLWNDQDRNPQYWYLVFHTLWWLDYYLTSPIESYAPVPPYGLEEMDPAGVLPPRVYTKAEMRGFLAHGREKTRATLERMTTERAAQPCGPVRPELKVGELVLYNMRHVQHHAAQLNLLLRQTVDSAPRWVGKTAHPLHLTAQR